MSIESKKSYDDLNSDIRIFKRLKERFQRSEFSTANGKPSSKNASRHIIILLRL